MTRCVWVEAYPQWASVLPYLSMAENHGSFPVAGGMLDQTPAFLSALLIYKAEVARHQKASQERQSKHG